MRHGIGIVMVASLLLVGLAASPAPALAAQPPLVFASETPAWSGSGLLNGTAAVIGTFFYAPFKATFICLETAVAAGATLAVGDRASAESLVRIGCTGSYLTTPEMIRGRREFYEGGGPIVEPPSIRLLPVSSQ